MNIFITGGSGLIGSNLIPLINQSNVTVYTRNVAMAENILGHKVHFVSDLNLIQASDTPPSVLISGSAIGYYGRQDNTPIDESFDSPYEEFSHSLCAEWERIALQAESKKTRVCILRTGVVISKRGGALQKMLPPFKLGLGGPIASGQQYMSWIHLEDVLQGILHLIQHQECSGVYNFTAPNPVTNQEFSQKLAATLNRPCIFRMPEFVMRLLMGEMADLLIYGQRVVPKRLLDSGYQFVFAELSHVFDCVKK
jgi:uncharacterized protein (TIGR01777 family)